MDDIKRADQVLRYGIKDIQNGERNIFCWLCWELRGADIEALVTVSKQAVRNVLQSAGGFDPSEQVPGRQTVLLILGDSRMLSMSVLLRKFNQPNSCSGSDIANPCIVRKVVCDSRM